MRVVAVVLGVIVSAFVGFWLATFLGILVAGGGMNLHLAFGGRDEIWQFAGLGAGIFGGVCGAILAPLGAFGLLRRRVLWALLVIGAVGLAVGVACSVLQADSIVTTVWMFVSAFVGGRGDWAIACLVAKLACLVAKLVARK